MIEFGNIATYIFLFISLFFEVFLLITYLDIREELKFETEFLGKNVKNFPSVTVIVPCFNEENTLAKTVYSILDLDYPKDKLSIILVDDGSTDRTADVLAKFAGNSQVSILSKENGGKHTALNFALEHVKTDLVGCLDADSFVNSDALRKIVPYFDDMSVMAVTPSIKVFEPSSILQYIQKIEYNWGIFLRRMLSSLGALYVTPGPFSIFRVKVFKNLGGYRHAHQTEDLEMALRMQKNRYKIVNSQGAHVYTVAPKHLKALYKQRVRWVYGFLNNAIDYREMFFNKKYGHIGMFILPIATSSIFSTLYIASRAVYTNASKMIDLITRIRVTGLNWNLNFSFDWFFFDTGLISFLTYSSVVFALVILYLALKMSDGKARLSKGVIYYLALYVFIVPLWLTKAVLSTIFRKQISWR